MTSTNIMTIRTDYTILSNGDILFGSHVIVEKLRRVVNISKGTVLYDVDTFKISCSILGANTLVFSKQIKSNLSATDSLRVEYD